MKIIKLLCLVPTLFLTVFMAFGQAKKPTIMIVPADIWMNERGYTKTYDNQGKTVTEMDYDRAFLENSEIKIVINKMQEMMNGRDFPTKDLEQALKTIKSEDAENAMLTSKNGGEVAETPIDKLRKVAKADIWMEIYWKVNTQGPRKSISFTLKGIDAYTDKPVGNAGSTGPQSVQSDVAILLEEAVLAYLDNFNAQLQSHFDDMFTNGREVVIRIKKFDSFDGDLESEYDGQELGSIIETWISDNTQNHRFNTTDATENMMLFEQVRIPLYDANGKAIDARGWTKGLQSELKTKYGITSKLMTKGLGQAVLVIGDK
jgi:hypothetical protein